MKQYYKGVIVLQFALCLILILHGKGSTGKPLTPDDVEGLLPPDPRDKNETIAAVVQDPVVQDAVHHAVSNGSLNGLVIKKHVFIMPATNPNLILSKREHLLVVPTENLQDVKKNITEAKEAETQTRESLPENQAIFEDDESRYLSEGNENGLKENEDGSLPSVDQSSNEKRKSGTEFLRNKLTREVSLPQDSSSMKVAVPIVAVIDPSNAEKGHVKSPIVAVLPHRVKGGELNDQIQFLKDNGEKIQKKAQDYVDQSSLTITPNYWRFSTPSEIVASSPVYSNDPVPSYADQGASSLTTNEMFLPPLIVSQWEMLAPSVQDDRTDYSGETDLSPTTIINDVD
ncbi:uncharacterized protein LOC100868124 isoform X2 [Apis florea]|uniref:uncharacterized protein LOC100868124 isoform X2 n=1 Tax=Apis florea TaxID=7463 RepID=UPI0006296474|nr:uncharacterized protein LOC100868124 isoform X2 [Apis florea]